ncbi:MAG: DUF3991 domain-containing protein [Ruminococcus sp.]|nr:DUF3991 domain-containing protein [Ruminococcus sp.]
MMKQIPEKKSVKIEQLKTGKIWTNWVWNINQDGKKTKIPLSKVNDKNTWITYQQAADRAKWENIGIGIMFAKNSTGLALCGIDIDAHNVDTNPLAKEIMDMFSDTYIEKSPSGKGYHILFFAELDKLPQTKQEYEKLYKQKNSELDIECYISGITNRYFTFTGNQTSENDYVTNKTDTLLEFLQKYMTKTSALEGQLEFPVLEQSELTEEKEAEEKKVNTTVSDTFKTVSNPYNPTPPQVHQEKKKNQNQDIVQCARETDLLSYLKTSGYTISQHGQQFYVKQFPGLCIKPESNAWYHFYTNQGRTNNSIDCLTLILGRSFKQAVYELTGKDVSNMRSSDYPKKQAPQYTSPPPPPKTEKENKVMKMPEQAPNMRQLFAYFCQTRKIPAEIVEELVHANLLYQSQNNFSTVINGVPQTFKNANAVFVHRNEKGEAVGGEIQGCNSFKRFKGIVAGTGESAFMFSPFPAKDGKPKRAYIFESAIDLMSFYTFCDKKKLTGAVFVSMAGLKPAVPKKLQEQGVKIISCVDNDDAGRQFEKENNFERSESVKGYLDYKGFKDWNELLVFKSENPDVNIMEKSSASQEQKNKKTNFFSRRK